MGWVGRGVGWLCRGMMRGPGRLPRLKGFDYSSPGYYFLTFTTWRWERLFGEPSARGLVLNPLGQIVQDEWIKSLEIRETFVRDAFVVMPDHFHALVGIAATPSPDTEVGLHRRPRSISSLIGCFKASCTKRINEVRGTPGRPVWRSRFHDHVVRDERALHFIRVYINRNPRKLLLRLGLE